MTAMPIACRRPFPAVLAPVVVLALLAGPAAGLALAQGQTVRLHVKVETRGGTGEQVSRFWAFTTRDEAGTDRMPVSRLCVTGVGHQSQQKCAENADQVEVEERATGLPGVGNKCVEAQATATWESVPVNASARACP